MPSFSTYLECSTPSGGKFWSVHQDGCEMTVAYGAVGTKGSVSTKKFSSEAQALKEAQTKLKEKTKKGYQEVHVDGKEAAQSKDDGKKRSSAEEEKVSPETKKAKTSTRTAQEAPPPFSQFLQIKVRGGGKRWWSIHQEGLDVTEASGKGAPPGDGKVDIKRNTRDSAMDKKETKTYTKVEKALAEAQKLHKRKVKQGFQPVEGMEAIQPEKKVIPETQSQFLTCYTKTGGKFWSVQQNKKKLTICYGPMGADGTETHKEFDSIEKAYNQVGRLAWAKEREGYLVIRGMTPPIFVGDSDTTIAIGSLEEAMALPIRIVGYWRDVSDYTADYVVKFVLERQQKAGGDGDWSFSLLHQECCVHDGVFYRSKPRGQDVAVSFDEEQAKAVWKALVDVIQEAGGTNQPIKLRGQFKPPEGVADNELWKNIEVAVECQGVTLLKLFVKSVPSDAQNVNKLEEKPQSFLDAFQSLVGLTVRVMSALEGEYKGYEKNYKGNDDKEERRDMKSMPYYL